MPHSPRCPQPVWSWAGARRSDGDGVKPQPCSSSCTTPARCSAGRQRAGSSRRKRLSARTNLEAGAGCYSCLPTGPAVRAGPWECSWQGPIPARPQPFPLCSGCEQNQLLCTTETFFFLKKKTTITYLHHLSSTGTREGKSSPAGKPPKPEAGRASCTGGTWHVLGAAGRLGKELVLPCPAPAALLDEPISACSRGIFLPAPPRSNHSPCRGSVPPRKGPRVRFKPRKKRNVGETWGWSCFPVEPGWFRRQTTALASPSMLTPPAAGAALKDVAWGSRTAPGHPPQLRSVASASLALLSGIIAGIKGRSRH